MEDIEIVRDLLRKFHKNNVWGKHHFRQETMLKGFPSHQKKRVLKVAEKLRKKALLVKFPTSHGIQWFANINKLKDIEELIRES